MRVPYRNRGLAIQFGDVICRALESGKPFSTLVNMTTSDGYYSTCQARALIWYRLGQVRGVLGEFQTLVSRAA